jgi:hypothetical protein
MPHQLETVVAPEHFVAYEDRRYTEDTPIDRFPGVALEPIGQLVGFRASQRGISVETRGGKELPYDLSGREVAWICPSGCVDRMMVLRESSFILGDEGSS